jgi:SagB-type dehydrogenase family enzyme
MPAGPAAELHRACAAARPAARDATGPSPAASPGSRPTGAEIPLPDVRVRLADGVERRCSPLTGYRPQPISTRALAGVLQAAARRGPAHLPAGAGEPVGTELCLVALRVEGLPPGAYRYDPGRRVLRAVRGEHVATLGQGRLRPNTRAALRDAAAVLVPVGDPFAGVARYGDLWYRLQQIETGAIVQQATLAAFALGLAARIHSDGTNDATDRVLGLTATARCGLSFLVTGTPRTGGPLVARRIPSETAKEVIATR